MEASRAHAVLDIASRATSSIRGRCSGMRPGILLAVLATVLAVPASAQAHVARLLEPIPGLSLSAGAFSLSGASNDAGGLALSLFEQRIGRNVREIAHRDADGRWRRFALPDGDQPEAVQLAALEDGRFLAAWDAGSAIRVREWAADGTLGPVTTVLDGVVPVGEGDSPYSAWNLRANRTGTVVIAAAGSAARTVGAVYAVVRDPGAGFGPVQQLTPTGVVSGNPRVIRIGVVGADGSALVQWDGGDLGTGDTGEAVRGGTGQHFGAARPQGPVVPAWRIDSRPPGATMLTDTSDVLNLGRPITRLCPCMAFQRFAWRNGSSLVMFLAGPVGSRAWYVAYGRRTGFRDPVRVSERVDGVPVQLAGSGQVAFARSTASTDFGLFRFLHSDIYLQPFGLGDDLRPPKLTLGPVALALGRVRLVPVWCDEPCRVRGTVAGASGPRVVLRVRDAADRPRGADLESWDIAWLRVPVGRGAKLVRVSVSARDGGGRIATAAARYLPRGSIARYWCRAGATARDFGCG